MSPLFFYSLINPAIAGVLSVTFACLWLFRPGEGYLALLSGSFFCCGLGFIANDFLQVVESPGLRLLVNTLFFAAGMGACVSALDRARAPVPAVTFVAICTAAGAIFCWFLFVDPSVVARIYTLNTALGLVSAISVRQLLVARPATAVDWLFVCLGGFGVLVATGRTLATLVRVIGIEPDAAVQASSYWATVQAITPVLAIVIAITFIAGLVARLMGELKQEADRDYLTGLLNRRGFDRRVQAALAEPAADLRAALMILDRDNFKWINDNFGHPVGDQVIIAVGRVLAKQGKTTLVARMGGEEFALFHPQASRSDAAEIASDIRVALRAVMIAALPPTHVVTASIGIHMRRAGETLSEMIVSADRALYQVKARGKDAALIAPPDRISATG